MTRLSNRQWPMLKTLSDNGSDSYMSIEEAQQFDQRPFRSMLIQGWCEYKSGRGFHITKRGKAAMNEFETTDIIRMHPEMPLTSYFDPTAYGLTVPKGRKESVPSKKPGRVHVIARRNHHAA